MKQKITNRKGKNEARNVAQKDHKRTPVFRMKAETRNRVSPYSTSTESTYIKEFKFRGLQINFI